jgi:hypothetical protein
MVALTLTNDGHNLIRDSAKGVDVFKVTYFALGTSNNAVSASDHFLGNEQYRRGVTQVLNGGAVGEVLISCYVPGGDAIGLNVQELGIFGGNGASSSFNSGVLIARVLWIPSTNPKTALVSFQLQLDLIC